MLDARRIDRPGQFMTPALLASQLAALEDPRGEPGVAAVEVGAPLAAVIAAAIAAGAAR